MQPVTVRTGNMSPFAAKLPQVPGRNSPRLPRLKGAVCGRRREEEWLGEAPCQPLLPVVGVLRLPRMSVSGTSSPYCASTDKDRWHDETAEPAPFRSRLVLSLCSMTQPEAVPPLSSSTNSSMDGSLEDLVKRFHDLEVSQAKLRDQLQWMLDEGREGHAHGMRRREGDDAGPFLPGHFADGPYRSVLKHIGHALHIYRPHTGEIIFWSGRSKRRWGCPQMSL
ncbi:hypothetical protein B296_00049271 [Ensete ventricosum]|uniref:Uncharacterized protein n=1 Tax=Ensete ventricosum TaxID=4639 RepID=A0A426YRC9_ENSVE|nr:hypothetical protein B296_00049271 [Ensete ventricosum]